MELALETDNFGRQNLVFLPKLQKINEIILKPNKNQYVFIGDARPYSLDTRSKEFGYIKSNEIKLEVISLVYSNSKYKLHNDEKRYLINLSEDNIEKSMKLTIKGEFGYEY